MLSASSRGGLSGSLFALSSIFLRKGVYRSGESFTSVPISVFIGTLFLDLPILISAKTEQVTSLSWLGIVSLAAAGIVHFLIGRISAYTGFRLIDANRAVPILTCNIVLAAMLAVFFLRELITFFLVPALFLIIGGIILISRASNTEARKLGIATGSSARGVSAALRGMSCWAASPTLVKTGLKEVNSPLSGSFVSYAAASVIIGIFLFHPRYYEKLRRLDRASLIPLLIGGLATSLAQIVMYAALEHSSVTMVTSLVSTSNMLFIFPLSFLINRQIEVFNFKIIIEAIIIIGGIFLLLLAV